jgi:hypothetical protein
MPAIGRALKELFGVLVAGFVGFAVMLVYAAIILAWVACGLACFCLFMVALFCMVMWLATHNGHALHMMVGYFVYAGAAHALIATMSYYRSKLSEHLNAVRGPQLVQRLVADAHLT